MRRLIFGVAGVLLFAGTAQAQGLGYGVGGLAGVSGFFGDLSGYNVAGGGEGLVAGRVGAGGEFGLIGDSSRVLAVVSANGVYHVMKLSRDSRRSPFVTGGYTWMGSGDGSFNAWNVGAGMDFWSRGRTGFRVEFRDHIRPDSRGTVQYWTARGGIVWR